MIMIKLSRPQCPEKLTQDVVDELTAQFAGDHSKKVWDKPWIRTPLLQASHSKCAYCERRIGPGYGDVHIDHFKPKKLHPEKVIEWENLVPSCGNCNRHKSDFDTEATPIVNPFEYDPKSYFYLRHARYYSIDRDLNSVGNTTIDVLRLNDLDDKCLVRFILVVALVDKLDELLRDAKETADRLAVDVRRRNRLVSALESLLKMCIPSAEYSAFTATAIHDDESYEELKSILKSSDCWTEELKALDEESSRCVFLTCGT